MPLRTMPILADHSVFTQQSPLSSLNIVQRAFRGSPRLQNHQIPPCKDIKKNYILKQPQPRRPETQLHSQRPPPPGLLSGVPQPTPRQRQALSMMQTMESGSKCGVGEGSSSKKLGIQTQGSRNALATLSASYLSHSLLLQAPVSQAQPLESGRKASHPHNHQVHKSQALVLQKPNALQRLQSPTGAFSQKLLRVANTQGADAFYLPRDEPAAEECGDSTSDDQHELLFTQVLERSMDCQNQIRPHSHQSKRPYELLQRQSPVISPQQQAESLASDIVSAVQPEMLIQRAAYLCKELDGFATAFYKEVGPTRLVGLIQCEHMSCAPSPLYSLQLINQVVQKSGQQALGQLLAAGIISKLLVSAENPVQPRAQMLLLTECAQFLQMLFESTAHYLRGTFLACNGTALLSSLLAFEQQPGNATQVYSRQRTGAGPPIYLLRTCFFSVLSLYDESHDPSSLALAPDEITRLLLRDLSCHQPPGRQFKENKQSKSEPFAESAPHDSLVDAIVQQVAQLISWTDNVYCSRGGANSESQVSEFESCLEQGFEVLLQVARGPSDVQATVLCSSLFKREAIQSQILCSLSEPSPVTFQVARWSMKLLAQCASNGEQVLAALAEQGIIFLLHEMLKFFLGLAGHIQLASIYDSLKLVLALCRGDAERTIQALDCSLLEILHNVADLLEKQASPSRTKRSKLLQLCCALWREALSRGASQLLLDQKIHCHLIRVLHDAASRQSVAQVQLPKEQDLSREALKTLKTWLALDCHQARLVEALLVEHVHTLLLSQQPQLLSKMMAHSAALVQAIAANLTEMHQQIILQQKQIQANKSKVQRKNQAASLRDYYRVLLLLKKNGYLQKKMLLGYLSGPHHPALRQLYSSLFEDQDRLESSSDSNDLASFSPDENDFN